MNSPTEAGAVKFNMAAYCLAPSSHRPPEKTALEVYNCLNNVMPSEVWTYARLDDVVRRIAAALQDADLPRGAHICIRMENTSAYALLFFGAIAGGFVPLPMSSQLTASEAAFLLQDSRASAVALSEHLAVDLPKDRAQSPIIFTEDDVTRMMTHERRANYANTTTEDPAYLIYTSGTTSRPKGVLHAQRAAIGRKPMYDGWYGIKNSDRMLHAGAFNWTYTLGTGLTDQWVNGATSIIYTGPKDPAIWPALIKKSNATLFAAVPGLFRQILKYTNVSHDDIPTLRHGLIAGEAPPPTLFEDWFSATGTHLYEAIGMSEVSTYISTSPTVPRKPGTIGKPQPGRKIAVLPHDEGNEPLPPNTPGLLAVHRSDPGLMLRYWNRSAEEADVYRGDWFVGGDLAMIDDDGYVTHLGRNNDIMKALGYRVSPHEVEAVLLSHPDVAEVACGELRIRADVTVIAAFVVLAPGVEPDIKALKNFSTENLADYKRPREYRFVESLPRTANGKIRRTDLISLA